MSEFDLEKDLRMQEEIKDELDQKTAELDKVNSELEKERAHRKGLEADLTEIQRLLSETRTQLEAQAEQRKFLLVLLELLLQTEDRDAIGTAYANAQKSNLSVQDTLRLFASASSSSPIRLAVARHTETPEDALLQLAKDDDIEIRQAVASNESATKKVLALLKNDPDEDVLMAVAQNERTTRPVLHYLAKNDNEGVRKAVATNSNLSFTIGLILAKDDSDEVRDVADRSLSCGSPLHRARYALATASDRLWRHLREKAAERMGK
jgi:uncharacterized protein YehS (DUF1456 family)